MSAYQAADISRALFQVSVILDNIGRSPTPSVMTIRACAADLRYLSGCVAFMDCSEAISALETLLNSSSKTATEVLAAQTNARAVISKLRGAP